MKFSEKLKQLLGDINMSYDELARNVNIDSSEISKWLEDISEPTIEQLKKLSNYLNVSIDELLGNNHRRIRYHHEYISNTRIGNLPLVHVSVGRGVKGLKPAKGIIAIGNIACGVLAIGGIATGGLCIGGISLGLISIAGLALGLISIAGLSIGLISIGGIALGFFSVGGIAIGVYSVGGISIAEKIALGGYAKGAISIGKYTEGSIQFNPNTVIRTTLSDEIRSAIIRKFPDTKEIIIKIFTFFK